MDLVLATACGRLPERRLHLHDGELAEHVDGDVALQRRDAKLLHVVALAPKGFGRRLHGRRNLGVDGLEAPPVY